VISIILSPLIPAHSHRSIPAQAGIFFNLPPDPGLRRDERNKTKSTNQPPLIFSPKINPKDFYFGENHLSH